ncbi:hypothetical protein PQR12_07310 [Paraburkholderia nemoris]|uniref:hypothetical protein n=1 Tax=Paraburkholderia nemoris TaxID=2793076 RepID=UPI0038BD2E41
MASAIFGWTEYPIRRAGTLARDPGAMAGRYCRSNAGPHGQRLPGRRDSRGPIGMGAAQAAEHGLQADLR